MTASTNYFITSALPTKELQNGSISAHAFHDVREIDGDASMSSTRESKPLRRRISIRNFINRIGWAKSFNKPFWKSKKDHTRKRSPDYISPERLPSLHFDDYPSLSMPQYDEYDLPSDVTISSTCMDDEMWQHPASRFSSDSESSCMSFADEITGSALLTPGTTTEQQQQQQRAALEEHWAKSSPAPFRLQLPQTYLFPDEHSDSVTVCSKASGLTPDYESHPAIRGTAITTNDALTLCPAASFSRPFSNSSGPTVPAATWRT